MWPFVALLGPNNNYGIILLFLLFLSLCFYGHFMMNATFLNDKKNQVIDS